MRTLDEAQLETLLRTHPFNPLVFLFPAWAEIYTTDSERDHSFEHAVRVHALCRDWYRRQDSGHSGDRAGRTHCRRNSRVLRRELINPGLRTPLGRQGIHIPRQSRFTPCYRNPGEQRGL